MAGYPLNYLSINMNAARSMLRPAGYQASGVFVLYDDRPAFAKAPK
jgi:hypothetical protein